MMYLVTPTHSVAFNAKAGSSTLARGIIKAFYPEEEASIQNAHYPPGKGPDNGMWHMLCPSEEKASKPIVAVIREPLARFKSACGFLTLDPEAVLGSLERGEKIRNRRGVMFLAADNPHFSKQSLLDTPGATLFRLEDIDAAATLLGLETPLPHVNEGGEAPVLTAEQEARVLAWYAADAALYARLGK